MKNDKYKNLKTFHFANMIKKSLPTGKRSGVIFGNFGAMNLGDEAILAGEIYELSKIKNLKVSVVSRNPKNTESLHKVKAISLYSLLTIIRQVRKSNFVIVGGGGIICKADRGIIGFIYQLYMLLLYFIIPRIYKKKIYAMGLGIYKNSNPIILSIATHLLRFAEIVTVRDYHSFVYLKSKKLHAGLYKDNSYLMNLAAKSEVLKDKFFKKKYNSKMKNMGLALLKPDSVKEEKYLLSEIEKMLNKNYKDTTFWFYACDYQNGYFNDEQFAQKIYKTLGKNLDIRRSMIIVPPGFFPIKFFSSFKLMDSFISMRLHAAIFSYRNRIDFLGITYDEKCTSFLESIGKKPIDIQKFDIRQISRSL